jgi:hypothetical protein
MNLRHGTCAFVGVFLFALANSQPAAADPFLYSNLNVNVPNTMATASRPGASEIESADDFVLGDRTLITHATFIGLVVGASGPISQSTISDLNLEIYRVFPKDSTDPPSGSVPTRMNSPSDVALDERNGSGISNTTVTSLSSSFTASNSVQNGIIKSLTPFTGGEGPVTGQEVRFDVTFATPFDLQPDHYFFVPQVGLSDGAFFWLSASRPISGAGSTPFLPDLQEWIRNEALQPDWLRVGTDIVGSGNTFNAAFALEGETVPEPATLTLLGCGLVGLAARARGRKTRKG